MIPISKMIVSARIIDSSGKSNDHRVYQGEAQMNQAQSDAYKAVIGDGLGDISVTRELSEKDYGNGGSVMVTVSLTCGQSAQELNQAIALAFSLADGACWHYNAQVKAELVKRGVLKP